MSAVSFEKSILQHLVDWWIFIGSEYMQAKKFPDIIYSHFLILSLVYRVQLIYNFFFFFLMQVAAKKLTLKNVTDYIVDVISKRSELGYNYGVILIPEGLIDFIPEVFFLLF